VRHRAVIEKVVVGGNKGLANAVVSVPGPRSATAAKGSIGAAASSSRTWWLCSRASSRSNSDDILHNLHMLDVNPSINKAQPKFKKTTEKLRSRSSSRSPATCTADVGWAAGPVRPASPTPTAWSRSRTPAGKQKVEVWHETLGKMEKEVDVKAGAVTKVSFEMKGK
jgi:hypothetical protein